MSLEYLLSSLGWSMFGFVLGFFLARTTRDIHEIKEAVMAEDEPPRPVRRRQQQPVIPNRILGWGLVILSVLTVISVTVVNIERQRVTDCQAKVNLDLIEALNARARISDDDRKALDDLITSVVAAQGLPTDAERRRAGQKAIQAYVDTISASKAARSRAPLPTPENYQCDHRR